MTAARVAGASPKTTSNAHWKVTELFNQILSDHAKAAPEGPEVRSAVEDLKRHYRMRSFMALKSMIRRLCRKSCVPIRMSFAWEATAYTS